MENLHHPSQISICKNQEAIEQHNHLSRFHIIKDLSFPTQDANKLVIFYSNDQQ